MDYVIRNTPVKEKKILPYLTKPLNGFTLSLYDTVYKNVNKVFVLSRDNDPNDIANLAKLLEQTRQHAVLLKNLVNHLT